MTSFCLDLADIAKTFISLNSFARGNEIYHFRFTSTMKS